MMMMMEGDGLDGLERGRGLERDSWQLERNRRVASQDHNPIRDNKKKDIIKVIRIRQER
jgi:hypothetical protein